MLTEMFSHFIHLLQILKKKYFEVIGQAQTAPREQNFDVNRKALSLYSCVASFKEISFMSGFIHFLFIMLYIV